MSGESYFLLGFVDLVFALPAFWLCVVLWIARIKNNARLMGPWARIATWGYLVGQCSFQLGFPPVQPHVFLNLYRGLGLPVAAVVTIVTCVLEIRSVRQQEIDYALAVQEAALRLVAAIQESKVIKGSDDANTDH